MAKLWFMFCGCHEILNCSCPDARYRRSRDFNNRAGIAPYRTRKADLQPSNTELSMYASAPNRLNPK